jgi:hypothetical protein
MGAFFGQSAKISFDSFGCKKSFATFGYIFPKLHYFNQQKLHDMQNCHFYLSPYGHGQMPKFKILAFEAPKKN